MRDFCVLIMLAKIVDPVMLAYITIKATEKVRRVTVCSCQNVNCTQREFLASVLKYFLTNTKSRSVHSQKHLSK